MRLHSLTLKNLKCFSEAHIEFDARWNVLIGENGTGKSTLLRILCMAAFVEEPLSPSLLPEPMVRHPKESLDLAIRLCVGTDGLVGRHRDLERVTAARVQEVVCVYQGRRTAEGSRQSSWAAESIGHQDSVRLQLQPRKLIAPIVFIPAIRPAGKTPERIAVPIESVPTGGAVAGMNRTRCLESFDSHQSALETLAKAQLRQSLDREAGRPQFAEEYNAFRVGIRRLLPEYELQFFDTRKGTIEIQGPTGVFPFHALSDGEKSTLAIAVRIVEGMIYHSATVGAAALDSPAIVFIDELDAHLHPAWQRRIIPSLNRLCPNAQFVVATHSPLVLTGLVGLDAAYRIHRLLPTGDGVRTETLRSEVDLPLAKPLTALLSELFGVTDLPLRVAELHERIAELLSRLRQSGLPETDRSALENLQAELDWLSGLGPPPRGRIEPGMVHSR